MRGAAAGGGARGWDGHGVGDGRGRAHQVGVEEVSRGGGRLGDGRSHLREHVVGEDEGHHGRHHLGRWEPCGVRHLLGERLPERWVNWVDGKHPGGEGSSGDAGLGADRRPGGGVCGGSQGQVQGDGGVGGGARSGVDVAPAAAQRAAMFRRLLVLQPLAAAAASVPSAAAHCWVVPRTAHPWRRGVELLLNMWD